MADKPDIAAIRGYANEAQAMSAQYYAMGVHQQSIELAWRATNMNAAVDEIERLRSALSSMLTWFGTTHKDEWMNDSAFAGALEAIKNANAALRGSP